MGGNQSEAHSQDWVRPSTEHKVKRNKCQRVREKPSFMDILCTHGRSWVWQKYKWCHGFSDMTRHRCRYVFDGWNNRMMIRWLSSRQDWWLIPGATPTLLWNKAFGCISDWLVAFRWISVLTSCISHFSFYIALEQGFLLHSTELKTFQLTFHSWATTETRSPLSNLKNY